MNEVGKDSRRQRSVSAWGGDARVAVWADEDQAFGHEGGGDSAGDGGRGGTGHRDSEFGGGRGRMCVNRQTGYLRLQFFI